jgi:hypothetical protein
MKFHTKLALLSLLQLGGTSAFLIRAPTSVPSALALADYEQGEDVGAGVDASIGGGMTQQPNFVDGRSDFVPAESRAGGGGGGSAWDALSPITIQGGSLRTWSFTDPNVERVQVLLKTDGRPLNCNVDLWQGPDNTPERIGIYIEDGSVRPFCAVIETPRGPNSIAIRNTAQLEFPIAACVEADDIDDANGLSAVTRALAEKTIPQTIQGGAIRSYSFAPQVESVQILLKTDGRPLNARIELLQGPNNNKQVVELYTEDGLERPFFAVIETPGSGNVVRVLNTAPVEFPIVARVEPYLVAPGSKGKIVVSDDGPLSYGNLLDR